MLSFIYSSLYILLCDGDTITSLLIPHRLFILPDVMLEMGYVQFGHAVEEDINIFLLTGANEGLDVFSLILFQYDGGQHVVFHLQEVHEQATGTTIAVCPRVNGDEFEVSPEAEVVDGAYV